MSDQDRERNPWARPTNKEAHAGILWLSGGMIVIGVIDLLAGQPAGAAGVITGVNHAPCGAPAFA